MSHRKGNVAEREVAKVIQAWWSQLEPGCEFVRTPLSGGWSTPKLRGEFKAAGDLMTTAKRWPYTVEVKRREAWSVGPLVAGQTSPVWYWWRQVQKAAEEEARRPMLWFRHNREPWCIMVNDAFTMLAMSLVPAVFKWERLLDVNVVGKLPVVYSAGNLLEIDPRRFATE